MRVDISLHPPQVSLAGQTLESCRVTTLPAFLLSSHSLSFSPFSHFTHLHPEGLRNGMESQAQQSRQRRSYTQSLLNFNIPKRRGTWAPAYVSTEQHLHGVNYNRSRENASGRGPTGGDQRHWRLKKKRQRQNHAQHLQQFTRAQFPSRQIWIPTNQIKAISHVSRELRARALQAFGGKRVEWRPSHSG